MSNFVMNPKIKELAEQAGFMMWADEAWKPPGAVVDWAAEYDQELEKFAELIVRECGVIADEYKDEHLVSFPSEEMKQRFGIDDE